MTASSRRPPPRPPSTYSIYPLKALDGVLAYIVQNGETVSYCFGPDERTVAAAVAERMPELERRRP